MGKQNKVYRIHKAVSEDRIEEAIEILDNEVNQRVIEEIEKLLFEIKLLTGLEMQYTLECGIKNLK